MTTVIGTTERVLASQADVSVEMAGIESAYQRACTKDLHHADPEGIELWVPASANATCTRSNPTLTIQHVGERMVVTGRIVDGDGRPVRLPQQGHRGTDGVSVGVGAAGDGVPVGVGDDVRQLGTRVRSTVSTV